ncbi:hypothetical protein [Endozoicomonas sp. YOMI1]|uniref:hypothetical protein n=1 Tax=Endozoicomonas sp. YOMI1 TaxID=2828739 RepID=UPI0021480A86|nr:hypothetical protein [Endozoicomonas sp. YOMI1]
MSRSKFRIWLGLVKLAGLLAAGCWLLAAKAQAASLVPTLCVGMHTGDRVYICPVSVISSDSIPQSGNTLHGGLPENPIARRVYWKGIDNLRKCLNQPFSLFRANMTSNHIINRLPDCIFISG